MRGNLAATVGFTAFIAVLGSSAAPAVAARTGGHGPAAASPDRPGSFFSSWRRGAPAGVRVTALAGARPGAGRTPGMRAGERAKLETITFKGIERNGHAEPPGDLAQSVGAINLATGKLTLGKKSKAGVVTIRVPAGRYDLSGGLATPVPTPSKGSVTLIDEPEVSVTHDLHVTFDARRGVPIGATLDRREGDESTVGALVQDVAGQPYILWWPSLSGDDPVYAVPTPRVTDRPYEFLAQVQADNSVPGPSGPGLATLDYSLAFPTIGRIPTRLSYRVHDSALARVRQTLREQGKPMTLVDELHTPLGADFTPFAKFAAFALGSEFYLPPGATVTEFLSPGSWNTFSGFFYGPTTGYKPGWHEAGPSVTYRAGHTYQDSWGSAALGVASGSTRLGNVITPDVLPDSASAPGHIDGDWTSSGLSGSVTLRRGATVVGTGSIVSQPKFTVPAARDRYTLSATVRRSVSWSALGTSAQATWTFRSGHVAGRSAATLPLWDVRISGAFDALDRAPAGRAFRLTVAPDLPSGAKAARITSITVKASFDDGKTWHPLTLRSTGAGAWTTSVTSPSGAKFVSLSASLTDAAGNSTRQAVIRAYQL